MATVDTLLVQIKADMSDLNKQLKKVERQVDTSSQKINRSLGSVAKFAKVGFAVIVGSQLLRGAKSIVDFAGSMEEMRAKAQVVFGEFFTQVQGQLSQFGDAVGRSTSELTAMASSVQDTFVPLGFARSEASKLSVELTKLAVDTASFNNASDTETMRLFQSALVGNHEAVRRFGIVITEAELKQELFRMGITKNANEVDAQTKVQARLNLIINGTKDAMGDAERTSGSFMNSQKRLSSAFDEFAERVITPLLPKLAELTIHFANIVEGFTDFLALIGLASKDLSTVAKAQDHLNLLLKKESDLLEILAKDRVHARHLKQQELKTTQEEIKKTKELIDAFNAEVEAIKNNSDAQKQNADQTKKVQETIKGLQNEIAILELKRKGGTEAMIEALKIDQEGLNLTKEQIATIGELINKKNQLNEAEIKASETARKVNDLLKEAINKRKAEAEIIAELQAENEDLNFEMRGVSKATIEANRIIADFGNMSEETADKVRKLVTEQHELQKRIKETEKANEEAKKRFEAMNITMKDLEEITERVGDSLADSLADSLVEGKLSMDSFRDAFKMFIKELIAEALRAYVIRRILASIFGGSTGNPTFHGGTAGGGTVQKRASGGGMPYTRQPVLVGERGPELFMPNTGGTVKNQMDTMRMMRGTSSGITINQNVNFTTGVVPTVRAEVINMLPIIKRETMTAVADAKQRGGSFSQALGGS